MSVAAERDARRIRRINLPLPIKVEHSVTKNNVLDEITRLIDVSAFGAGFILKKPIKRGRLLHMTMPLSRQLRNYDYLEPQYKVWGIVRHCIPIHAQDGERYAIGTAFIGKTAPRSYYENPSSLYEISYREESNFWRICEAPARPDETALPPEDRRHTRYQIPVALSVETLDDIGNSIAQEITVTENISLSGASIFTSLSAAPGTFVRVTSEQYGVTITAIVRNNRISSDGVPRLHIEFFDRYFPLEGIV